MVYTLFVFDPSRDSHDARALTDIAALCPGKNDGSKRACFQQRKRLPLLTHATYGKGVPNCSEAADLTTSTLHTKFEFEQKKTTAHPDEHSHT